MTAFLVSIDSLELYLGMFMLADIGIPDRVRENVLQEKQLDQGTVGDTVSC